MQCKRCGREVPDEKLNVEAHIHHHSPVECLDRKECEKAKRKQAKKTGRVRR